MTKEKLLMIAERNLKKAQIAFEHNYNRVGVTEQEKENLTNNVEYNRIVCNLMKQMLDEQPEGYMSAYHRAKERVTLNLVISYHLNIVFSFFRNRIN